MALGWSVFSTADNIAFADEAQNSDNGFERRTYLPWDTSGTLQARQTTTQMRYCVHAYTVTRQTPSNVTRICRALLPESEEGVQQVIYYQAGIGTESTFWNHVVGGGTGAGLSENIREAYAFLATNYEIGDEIILLGFSRGAFTARSIAGECRIHSRIDAFL